MAISSVKPKTELIFAISLYIITTSNMLFQSFIKSVLKFYTNERENEGWEGL